MFGKEKSTWEELGGIFTAQEIYQQPATWAKTIAQIKNEKEALKKFMEGKEYVVKDGDVILFRFNV